MFQSTDFHGCKYGPGTRICAACRPNYGSVSSDYRCDNPHHSVFAITDVSKNHGGPGVHYYHAEGQTGSVHIYESKIVLTEKPL